MRLEQFDFELPARLIAKRPASPRDHSQLLVVDRRTGQTESRHFFEIGEFLKAGDLLVLNNTKVFPARLFSGETEVFLLESLEGSPLTWKCLVRPGKKVPNGTVLEFPGEVKGEITRVGDDFQVRFSGVLLADHLSSVYEWLSTAGHPPLPPYLKRKADDDDRVSYQTVFAKETGSIAAPTAGLHFTRPLLDELKDQGIQVAETTLHVGYGTFAPLREENLDAISELHEERYYVPPATVAAMEAARAKGGRVIAVGTTALRALESGAASDRTRLFIKPGYEFKAVDGLITNFHLPKSSLFVLVAAFLGLDATQRCYRQAIETEYRFYSYGDAMAILPR